MPHEKMRHAAWPIPSASHLEIDRPGIDHAEHRPNGNDEQPTLLTSISRTVMWLSVHFVTLPINLHNPTFALVFHVSRRGLRHFAAKVSIDDTQREIDSGSQTTRSRDLLVLDKAQSAFEADIGKRLRKLIEEVVMSGG